ncbi:MAG: ABC transporter permease [Marmoricola sp.]
MTNIGTVALIAKREIQARIQTKAFAILTALLIVAVLGIIALFKLIGGGPTTLHVGVTTTAQPLTSALKSIGKAANIQVAVSDVSLADGQAKVRSGDLDAVVTGSAHGKIRTTVNDDLSDSLRGILTSIAQQEVLRQQISSLGGHPAAVAAAVESAGVSVTTLGHTDPHRSQRIAMSTVIGVLTYVMLMISIQLTGQGVVEEKSNRIVEILLAAVKPWQLLAGKVLGIGVVTIAQVALVAVVGAIGASVTGVLHLPSGLIGGAAAQAVLWYLLGYAFYAVLMAAAASLISRQEELAGVGTPFTLLIVASYIIGVSVLPAAPHGSTGAVLSMIPLFAPVLMPMRAAYGLPAWEVVVALLIMLAAIAIATVLAGRVYRNAVLRSGSKVSLRNALRGTV